MTVWYTSDLHIGHTTVAAMRITHANGDDPLAITQKHDLLLAENWDAVVTKRDIVYILGDLSLQGTGAVTRALQWVGERPGTKRLISGNHDPVHPGVTRQYDKWMHRYLEVFESVQPFARRKLTINGMPGPVTVLLSHFPYQGSGDHTFEERFTQWRLPDLGEWLLHGHTHSSEKVQGRMIHIGVDAWNLSLVSQETIEEIINDYHSR